jgi:thiosulfate dehydrogenase
MRFLAGFVIGLLVLPALVYVYCKQGYAPVATSAPPLPFERAVTTTALHARIAKEMPARSPVPADEANLTAGARVYRDDCAVCHGLPGQPQSHIAVGMFPKPPHLFRGKGVTDDPVGESYWKAANGIRLTGMPAFRIALTDEQIWQVSQLLANANQLPQAVREALSPPAVENTPVPAAPGK